MKADLELTSGVIRVFADGAEFGDPFEMAVYFVGDEGRVTLKGLRMDKPLSLAHARAIQQCLLDHGFREAVWHRWVVNPATGEKVRREVRLVSAI